ncbi:hypothetical protein ABIA33_003661 [Streptacidiphilus sp. MAP12-16]
MPLLRNAVRPGWDEPLVTTLTSLVETTGGLAVFACAADDRIPVSLINSGLIEHPATGRPVVAHVAYGDSRRVARLAVADHCSLAWHDGPKWLATEGRSRLVFGPWDERAAENDPDLQSDEDQYSQLLRTIYRSAGGSEHPDWPEFDAAMRRERRVAVLVDIDRLYGIHWD